MKKAYSLIVIFWLFLNLSLSAQKEGNIWYFGEYLGLDFNSNPPTLLTNGAINTSEGCSTISDKDGQLLMYTDGITIWNKDHEVIEGGTNLNGDPSATSSGLIVPKPLSATNYFVFTVDACGQGLDGLEYAEVDISLNEGKGKVLQKRIKVLPNSTEKVTGTFHQNGKDIWVITHLWDSDAFYAYLINENGVSTNPIISKTGSVHQGAIGNSIGYMKVSPKGDKIALAIHQDGKFEIFDFDNETGKVSNPVTIRTSKGYGYGIEFSPSGKYLYTSTAFDGEIAQYDMEQENIGESKAILRKGDNRHVGALQIAPNGKIYYHITPGEYIGAIAKPEKKGQDVELNDEVILLPGRVARYGLPTFIQTFFTEQNVEQYLKEFPLLEIAESDMETVQPFKINIIVTEQIFAEANNPSSEQIGKQPLYGVNIGESSLELFVKSDRDGKHTLDGLKDKDYTFTFVKNGYFNKVLRISKDDISEQLTNLNRTVTFEVEMEKIYKNIEVKLDNVYYDYDAANVQTNSLFVLDNLANMLKQNPQIKIQIAAHTDCRGDESYNQILSQERADFVIQYLISKGISNNRLTAQGFGEKVPAVSCTCANCSDAEHQMNRRTTFKVL